MSKQIQVNDLVIVYKDTPCFVGGAIVKVIDRDPDTGDFFCGKDMETALWIKPENMQKIVFDRPKKDWKIIALVSAYNQLFFMLGLAAWIYLG